MTGTVTTQVCSEAEWALDPHVAHLNHGSFGAVPIAVSSEQNHWRAQAEANPNRFFSRTLPARMDDVRDRVAAFVHAEPTRCVLVPNTTVAMSIVLASMSLGHDDEVLITEDTYVGVRGAVELATQRSGSRVVTAALGEDISAEAYGEAVLAAVTPRTRLAFIDHITSPTALVVDVAPLVGELRSRGIAVAVDGAHAPGAVPVDVGALDADFYAGNFHKWCCAPRGSGFLTVAERRVASLVPGVVGARAGEGFPSGFEWLGTNDYSATLSVPAALSCLERWGLESLWARNRRLVAAGAAHVASALGVSHTYSDTSPMAVVDLPDGVAATQQSAVQLRDALSQEGVEVAVVPGRGRGLLRLSAHLYNSMDDFHRLTSVQQALTGCD